MRGVKLAGVGGLALGLVLGAAGARGENVLVQTDFETDPGPWSPTAWGPTIIDPSNSWTTDAAHSGTHSIRATTGLWVSPVIPTTKYDLYAVTFYAQTSGAGFFGSQNDITGTYRTAAGWQLNQALFRGDGSPGAGVTSPQVFFEAPISGGAVYVDDVKISKVTPTEAAALQDQFYAGMHPYTFTASPTRHQYIPKAMDKLTHGQELNVVMLGDSIVNNTSHSYFEPLVDREYPGAKVDITTSTRGSTGAPYYQDPAQLQSYVFDYHPDLVMIGGISNQNDIGAMRSVVDQIKAQGIEVILMSEAAGSGNDPYVNAGLTAPLDVNGTSWRDQLYKLAGDEHVEFLDMSQWYAYIKDSGLPYSSYQADTIHMNAYGEQVAGRVLESYFAPVPEPTAAAVLAGVGLAGMGWRRRTR